MTLYSLVIPVYMNESSIPELLAALKDLNASLERQLEVVCVVDGSPDRSAELLRAELPTCGFRSRLIELSKNFGSFQAIRAGLREASGPWFAVMAADLQEPPELVLQFFRDLESEPIDVIVGTREAREDPLLSRISSRLFWNVYRIFVQRDMPPGGVDVFGCNEAFRRHLLSLREANSTLVGLIFWVGFRRKVVGYHRRARRHGRSAWTLARRLRYLVDSVFAFSDLPIRLLTMFGVIGIFFSLTLSVIVFTARMIGAIELPGYTATVLVITFFGALNMFGLGVIGSYVWRTFENTKSRPLSIVRSIEDFGEE